MSAIETMQGVIILAIILSVIFLAAHLAGRLMKSEGGKDSEVDLAWFTCLLCGAFSFGIASVCFIAWRVIERIRSTKAR